MRTFYPLGGCFLCLFPLITTLCAVRVLIGPDDAVFTHFRAVRAANPGSIFWMRLFSDGYTVLFYSLYLFLLYRGLKYARPADIRLVAAYCAAQLLIAVLLCRLVKVAVGRPRPMTGGPFDPFSLHWGYQSFPSGHTTEAVGASLPLLFRFRGRAVPLALGLLVALVGYSRLYLGMHHPTDIWGGIVFGCFSGYISWKIATLPADSIRRVLPRRVRDWPPAARFLEKTFT